MTKERNALKAGLFIVITIALALTVVISIKGAGQLTGAQQVRTVTFTLADDLGGLRVGDDVRVGGFRAGSVRAIEPTGLDTPDPRVLVTIALPARFPFRADARVAVQTTLTGTSVLNVESLGTGGPLADGKPLVGRPDPKTVLFNGVGETLPKIAVAADSFKETGRAATELVHNVNAKVEPVSDKVKATADKAGGMLDSVTAMIGPSTTDFHGTMANLNSLTGSLKEKLPGMIDKVDGTVTGARVALEDLQKTLANTKDISESLRGVLAGNRGKLDSVIGSLKLTGDNLKAASTEIRHSPWRLLYQPKQSELSNLNLFDSARQFAEGANELNDAAQALRDAANDKNANAKQVQQLVNRLEKTFANFHEVEQKLWADVKE